MRRARGEDIFPAKFLPSRISRLWCHATACNIDQMVNNIYQSPRSKNKGVVSEHRSKILVLKRERRCEIDYQDASSIAPQNFNVQLRAGQVNLGAGASSATKNVGQHNSMGILYEGLLVGAISGPARTLLKKCPSRERGAYCQVKESWVTRLRVMIFEGTPKSAIAYRRAAGVFFRK